MFEKGDKMKVLLCIFLLWIPLGEAYSQQKRKPQKKYKKYEYLDLGKLQVEGSFVAPTDIFIQERANKNILQRLYERKHFKEEIRRDVLDIR